MTRSARLEAAAPDPRALHPAPTRDPTHPVHQGDGRHGQRRHAQAVADDDVGLPTCEPAGGWRRSPQAAGPCTLQRHRHRLGGDLGAPDPPATSRTSWWRRAWAVSPLATAEAPDQSSGGKRGAMAAASSRAVLPAGAQDGGVPASTPPLSWLMDPTSIRDVIAVDVPDEGHAGPGGVPARLGRQPDRRRVGGLGSPDRPRIPRPTRRPSSVSAWAAPMIRSAAPSRFMSAPMSRLSPIRSRRSAPVMMASADASDTSAVRGPWTT